MDSVKQIKIMYGPCSDRVFGYIFENENEEKRNRTAVILFHGYNSCQADLEWLAKILAQNGYLALTVDFRGGGNNVISMGKTTDMSLKTEVEDATEAVAFLKRTREGQYDRLFLYGESQGGLVSCLTAAMLGDKVNGLLLLYPALCIPDDMSKVVIPEGAVHHLMGMDISKKYIDELPQFDVYEMIKSFPGSMTVAHGDADKTVNISYSQRLYEQQKALGRDVSLHVIENEGHGFSPLAAARWAQIVLDKLKES